MNRKTFKLKAKVPQAAKVNDSSAAMLKSFLEEGEELTLEECLVKMENAVFSAVHAGFTVQALCVPAEDRRELILQVAEYFEEVYEALSEGRPLPKAGWVGTSGTFPEYPS